MSTTACRASFIRQTYGFFGTNHADYKASSTGTYTLDMLSQYEFNHINVSIH